MSRIPVILNLLALTMALFSTTMLLPLALAWWTGDDGRFAFLAGLAVALGSSGTLWLATKDDERDLRIRDGFLLVTLACITPQHKARRIPAGVRETLSAEVSAG